MDNSHNRRVAVGAAVLLAAAACASQVAAACDVPIHQAAAEEWPREAYALFYCTQKGLKANEHLDATLKKAFDSSMDFVNLDLIRIDVNRPMLQEDRELMARRGIHPLPYAVLLDKDGKRVADVSGALDAAAWKRLQRAADPPEPFKVVHLVRVFREEEKPTFGPDTPFPVHLIDYDEADTADRKLTERLGMDMRPLPYTVLLDGKGEPVTEFTGPIDAKAWRRLKAAAEPAGPFKVVLFTKGELGRAGGGDTPMPVTVVNLDKPAPAGRALAGRLNVVNLPIVTMVSPRGTEIASFGADLGQGHLKQTVESPARQALVKELKGKIAVLLFIRSNDKAKNAAALKTIREGVKRGSRLFDGKLGLVEVDPTDAREEALFRILKIKRDGKEALTYAVFGRGKVLAVPPLKGKFTSNNVLDVVQIVMQNCTCVLNPSDLGEDLLLKWPVEKRDRD